MISNQIIQTSIDELKAITKVDIYVFDLDGIKVAATTEDIENVLVQPGATDDLPASTRPDGVTVAYTLHFPKGMESVDFRGCRIEVRGDWMEVVGDPTYYAPENTPGAWNYPVEVKRCDG